MADFLSFTRSKHLAVVERLLEVLHMMYTVRMPNYTILYRAHVAKQCSVPVALRDGAVK